jgi:predicted NUDIX family NTP pyrophosphohydrolase
VSVAVPGGVAPARDLCPLTHLAKTHELLPLSLRVDKLPDMPCALYYHHLTVDTTGGYCYYGRMAKQSAGILVFRKATGGFEVLLVHPGGPFWVRKDTWSIPKGQLEADEELLSGARREFEEEVGLPAPDGSLIDLGGIKQSGGKTNFIWAVEGDTALKLFKSNTFTMEWPPKSGQQQEFPENDRAAWFDLATAKSKIFKDQTGFIDKLAEELNLTIETKTEPEQQSLL